MLVWLGLLWTTGDISARNLPECNFVNLDGRTIVTELALEGLEHTHDYVVRRELLHAPGRQFSCEDWISEKQRLESLDLFSQVILTVREKGEGVALSYAFQELPLYFIFPAAKSGDINGWLLGLGGSAISILGHDIRADIYGRASVDPFFAASEFMLWFHAPYLGQLPIRWNLQLLRVDSINPVKGFRERSFEAYLDWYFRTDWNIQFLLTAGFFSIAHGESATLFEPGDGTRRRLFLSNSGTDNVPKMGLGLVFDNRVPKQNPRDGNYIELRFSMFGGPLGGPANYGEWLADYRGYLGLGGEHIIHLSILGEYRPGLMGPYSFFNVGGANSLRGYGLSSKNYGQHELLSALEYRFEMVSRDPFELWGSNLYYGLQWVTGIDWVMLWPKDEGRPNIYTSIYAGFHVLFPLLERIRFEFGIGEIHKGSQHLVYSFSIGLFEKVFMQRERIR